MTPQLKKWITWFVAVLLIGGLSYLGISYPLPPPPMEEVVESFGLTHHDNLEATDITATDDLAVADDATVGGDLAVTGASTLTATTLSADLTLANGSTIGESTDTVIDIAEFFAFTEQTVLAIAAGVPITPTGSYQPITSTAAVTTSTTTAIVSGTVTGQLLVIVNENASDAIIIDDGANTALGGNKTLTGGQGDALWLLWDGDNWICIGYNDN